MSNSTQHTVGPQGLGLAYANVHIEGMQMPGRDNNFNTTVNTNNHTVNNYISPRNSSAVDEQAVRDWLLSLSRVDPYARQKETLSKLALGTGDWIVDHLEFKAWLSRGSSTFWGVGIPGAGKTCLTSSIVAHLQSPPLSCTVLYAFCRFDDNLSVFQILATLLVSFYHASEIARSCITRTLYLPYKVMPSESDLMTTLKTIRDSDRKCIIVVDALDELDKVVRQKLVKALVSLQIPLFLTSREIDLPGQDFQKIRISAPQKIFESMIEQELEHLPNIQSLLQRYPEERQRIIDRVLVKSRGMLLLSKLFLSGLEDVTDMDSLWETINNLPVSLNGMYMTTLARIGNLRPREKSLAYRALVWVVHGSQELGITELLYALAVDPGSTVFNEGALTTESILVSVCCGLIEIERVTGKVRLIHYTTYEFFRAYWASTTLPENLLHLGDPHGYAATVCAVYLQIPGLKTLKDTWLNSGCHDLGVITTLEGSWLNFARHGLGVFVTQFPFVNYACMNIGYHTSQSVHQQNGKIAGKLAQILCESSVVPLVWLNRRNDSWRPPKIHLDFGSHIHFGALHGIESLLADSQGRLNELSQARRTPLFFAIVGGHVQMAKLLLGIYDTNAISPHSFYNNHASATQQISCFPEVDVNMTLDEYGQTALHIALEMGHDSIVALLLQHKSINVNVPDKNGCTALHVASQKDRESIVGLLLDHKGTNVNATDNHGQTALHIASRNVRVSVVKLLLQHTDIDVNVTDGDENTALRLAYKTYDKTLIQFFLQCGKVNWPTVDQNGWTDLHSVSISGDVAAVELVLQNQSVNINAADKKGRTALHVASAGGHESVVKALLQANNIAVNVADNAGMTALHLASMAVGQTAVRGAELLLGCKDIDVNATDTYRRTAFFYARSRRNDSIVRQLLAHPDLNEADKVAGEVYLQKRCSR